MTTDRHYADCPEAADDQVRWLCTSGHWLAWEVPPNAGDRCPVIFHDNDNEGRCYGKLHIPECRCGET